jgi:hypothetical protein
MQTHQRIVKHPANSHDIPHVLLHDREVASESVLVPQAGFALLGQGRSEKGRTAQTRGCTQSTVSSFRCDGDENEEA